MGAGHLQGTGQPPTTENYLAPNVNNGEVERLVHSKSQAKGEVTSLERPKSLPLWCELENGDTETATCQWLYQHHLRYMVKI